MAMEPLPYGMPLASGQTLRNGPAQQAQPRRDRSGREMDERLRVGIATQVLDHDQDEQKSCDEEERPP